MLRAQRRRPLAGKRRRLAAHPRATRRLVPQRPFENSGRVGSAGLFRPCFVGRPPGQPASAALSAYRGRNIPCGLSAARILRRSLIAEQVLAARIIWTTIFKARRGDKPFPGLVGEGRVMEAQVVELYRTAARPRSQVAPQRSAGHRPPGITSAGRSSHLLTDRRLASLVGISSGFATTHTTAPDLSLMHVADSPRTFGAGTPSAAARR